MALPEVNEFTVTTQDAGPSASPYRFSRIGTKGNISYSWTLFPHGVCRYWQVRLGGTDRMNGQVVKRRGMVCGFPHRCGVSDSRSLSKGSVSDGFGEGRTISQADFSFPAEGDYRLGLDAATEEGWSL